MRKIFHILFFLFYTHIFHLLRLTNSRIHGEILSFTNFIFLWSLYLTSSMSHKLYVQTLRFTNSSSHRIHVFHKFQILLILYSASSPPPIPVPDIPLYYSFLSAKNEVPESFIFRTNCFLLRREKSLDRFSIQPRRTREFPLGTRIFCMHRLRDGEGGKEG